MATSDFKATPGSGKNFATYSFTEDAETKDVGRAVLSNSSGTEIGTSSTPIQVSLANTATNATPVKVDGSGVVQPVSGTVTTSAVTDVAPATQNITVIDSSSSTATGANNQSIVIGTPTAGSAASFTLSSIETVRVEVTGIWTGTLTSEISIDGGTTWTAQGLHQGAYTTSSFTAGFIGGANVSGATQFRMRATAAITGTAVAKVIESINTQSVYIANAAPSGNIVSVLNSSTATLTSGSVYTGTSEDVSNFAEIRVSVFSDVASATDGLSLQQSMNNTNWDITDVYTVSAGAGGKTYTVPRDARYFRVVYTNGGTNQASFRLQTILDRMPSAPSSQRASDGYTNETDLIQDQSFGMVFNGTTWDRTRGDATNGVYTQLKAALPAGTAIIGKVTTDQTTHGTTDLVAADITKIGGSALSIGQQAAAASIPVVLTAAEEAQLGALTETAPTTDTASSGLNGRLQRVAQRITSLIALLPTSLGAGGGLKVDGSGTALPISASALPLPTGASTSAKQPALGTAGSASADVLTVQGITSMTPLKTDGSGTTQPVSGTVTVTQATGTNLHAVLDTGSTTAVTQATAANLNATVVGTGTFTTQSTLAAETTKVIGVTRTADGTGNLITSTSNALDINIKSGNPTTIAVTQATASSLNATVVGTTAPGSTAANNPIQIGTEGRSTRKTAVADGQVARRSSDLYGRSQQILPFVTNTSSAGSAITTNTNTSIVAAPGAGNHLRVYRVHAQNSAATATWMYWTEGSGGSKKYPMYLAQNQVAAFALNGVWELPTNTALFINTVTTGANIEWNVAYEIVAD